MFFRNIQALRLDKFVLTANELSDLLAKQAFAECGALDAQSSGWIAPRENGALAHAVNGQFLLALATEKKLLPTSVVNQAVKERCADLEEQQGYKPGKKQRKEVKEEVTDELLQKAFTVRKVTHVWIDPSNGWLVVDSASHAKTDEVFKWLLRSVPNLSVESLRVVRAPIAAMTQWLADDEAPAGFTVDQDAVLQSIGESRSTVKYQHHTLEAADIQRHIKAGKRCAKLALTWNDRISFVLDDALSIKRIAPLDVLKENTVAGSKDADERFDSDFALMTGELAGLLASLVAALGGEGVPEKGQLDIADIPAIEAEKQANEIDGDPDFDEVSSANVDEVYAQAVKVVRDNRRASISLVQRHLRIGYNRASRLIEQMEADGIISAMDVQGKRTINKEKAQA